MEVQLDERMMALGAILTASAKDTGKQVSALARLTYEQLRGFSSHPTVTWFREQLEKYELLTLSMQVEQLDGPPDFRPHAPEEIPAFVDMYFSAVLGTRLARASPISG